MYAYFLKILILQLVDSYMILSAVDLQGSPLNKQNWQAVSSDGSITNYDPTLDTSCQSQLFPLRNTYLVYQKTYSLTSQDFEKIYLEFEAYFIQFIPCKITILVNSQQIYQKQINGLQLTNICGGQDSQYTFFIPFYSTQNTLFIQIKYEQNNQNSQSFIGIRNLNIYTNGIPLINGCPYDKQFVQTDGSCVSVCSNGCQYLSGPYLGYCTNDNTCSSQLLNTYQTSQQIWKLYSNPTDTEKNYLNQVSTSYYLFNNNQYVNIMQSTLFTSPFAIDTQVYFFLLQNISPTKKLQLSFIFYIFGEWEDGSTVGINIQGSGIYVNNVLNISKSRNIYISSTGSEFYQKNITNSNGQSERVWLTLINFQSNFYASQVRIGFTQNLYSIIGIFGTYGFSDIQVYQADSDPNALLQGIYGIPYSCISPYFAYLGTCVLSCPSYSISSQTDRNCTDYLFTESKFLNPALIISGYSRYVVKEYYNQNFQESDIKLLYNIVPLIYKNFQSGQQYSFVGNKKILGGYNCWGSGTYGLQASAFSSHYQMRIHLTLYMIDDWQVNDSFSIYVDEILIATYSQVKTEQLTGTSSLDQKLDIDLKIPHVMKQVQLLFVCSLSAFDSTIASCGISDLFVLIDKNADIQCSGTSAYYSFLTGRCEKCQTSRCTFFPSYNPFSNKCTYACTNCQTTSTCLACDAQSGYLQTGNTCSCRNGFYASNTICFKCHYSCLTCTGQKSTHCLSPCPATRFYQSNQCLCPSNYVDVYNLEACQLIISTCHFSCLTCYGPQYYNCVTCPQNTFRELVITSSTSVCSCITNFTQELQNPVCKYILPCHYSCLTCQGSLSTDCLTCKPNYVQSGNQCICPVGYNILNSQYDCNQNGALCDQTCSTCIDQQQNKCISCDSQRLLVIIDQQNYQFVCRCIDGYYDDNNICQQCYLSCLTCSGAGQSNCLTCDSNKLRILINFNCKCQSGYNDYLNPGQTCVINLQNCHYSCNQCFGFDYDQCIECPILSNRELILNQCQCKHGFSEYNYSQACFQCDQTCLTCSGDSFDQCLSCDLRQFRILNGTKCDCIQGSNNMIDQSVCIQNYSPCNPDCETCYGPYSNNCLTCATNQYITNTNTCVCIQGYFKYQYQCLICNSEQGMITYECQYKNSTDGIWTYGEECDNGSNNIRDGCYNNVIQNYYGCTNIIKQQSICYKCPDHCQKCNLVNNIISCQQCDENYMNQQVSCVQCKDQSCQQCTTPQNCVVCNNHIVPSNGQCILCSQLGQYQIKDKCFSKCGDGIKTDDEQCDDGNLINFDGCNSFCQVEENYFCTQDLNQLSLCYPSESPSLILNLLNSSKQKTFKSQKLRLQTNQEVYYQNVELIYRIENCDNVEIDYQKKNNQQNELSYLEYNININFQQSCYNVTIIFTIYGEIHNLNGQNLINNTVSSTIEKIIVMNDNEIALTKQSEFVASSVVTSFAFVSLSSLMFGGASQLIQFLNLIQQILYLQYVDIDLPENLYQFLDIFNSFNLNNLFQTFSINNLLSMLELDDYFNSEPKQPKFQQFNLNSSFVANINGFMFAIFSGLFSYFLTQLFINSIQVFQKLRFKSYRIYIQYILGKLNLLLIRSRIELEKLGLFQIVQANSFDVQFAILMQISNINSNTFYSIINGMLSYGFLIVYGLLIAMNQRYDEEIKNKNFWQQSLNKLKLIEAFLFQVSIVLLQYYPQCQVMLISMTSLSIAFYIGLNDPYKNKLNSYKLISQEVILFIVTLTFNIYIYFPTRVDDIQVGWFHICLILFMLIISLVIDIYFTVLQLKMKLFKR